MHKAVVCNNVVRIIVFSIIECKNPDHLNAKLMNLFRIDTFKFKNDFLKNLLLVILLNEIGLFEFL